MQIFAGVSLDGASNDNGVVDDGNFLVIWVAVYQQMTAIFCVK